MIFISMKILFYFYVEFHMNMASQGDLLYYFADYKCSNLLFNIFHIKHTFFVFFIINSYGTSKCTCKSTLFTNKKSQI